MIGVGRRQVVLLVVKVGLLRRRRQNVVRQSVDRSTLLGATLRTSKFVDVGGVDGVGTVIEW